jgi:arylsulfatase A-like enzyme
MACPMNILFVMANQLAPNFLPAYGHPVVKALMTGEVTPLDFQPHDDASRRYCRGYSNRHEAEARDFLRFDP